MKEIFTIDYWKGLIIDKFIMSYVKGFFERLKGYTFFSSLLLLSAQIAAVVFANNESILNILNIIISALGDTVSGVASPNEITIAANAILAIYGLIMKLVKLWKGVPQVPTIVIKK